MPKCQSFKTNGGECSAHAGASGYCFAHDPGRGAERAAARKLGGLRRSTKHGGNSGKVPAAIRTLSDVLSLLDYAKDECLALENGTQRGRLLIALAAAYTETITAGELEQRVSELEARYGELRKAN